tara:strand:- start:3984 stop:5078 length:1095 start_codon:yes stop_codon:yes gene_type:complete
MKIFYLSNNSFPAKIASSIQTVKMCEAFSYLKHDVTLVSPNTRKFSENIFKFYDVKNRFKIKKIKFFKKFPLGFNYYFFSLISIIISLKYKPDIFITRNFFTSFLLVLFNKKHILELHHDIEIESRIVKFLITKTNYLNSIKLVKLAAITNSIKKYFVNNFRLDQKKIIVSPSGSSLSGKFKFNRNKRLKIGYFGSIYKSRGAETIINLSKVDKKNKYYIYGNLNKYKNLKNISDNLKLNNFVPNKELFRHVSKMDILLMPYLSRVTATGDVGNIIKYTSPLKLFDYLSSGKVIIASNLPVLKEVINNNNAIFIKNFDNIRSWKLEIDKISNNVSRRFIISKNNYKLSKKFKLISRAKKILKGI